LRRTGLRAKLVRVFAIQVGIITLAVKRNPILLEGLDRAGGPAGTRAGPQDLDIETALAGLDDDLRRVFMLREVQGLSHDEVAAELGISAGLSRVRLVRARRALMARLDP